MDIISDNSVYTDCFAFMILKLLHSPIQTMTTSNAGSSTALANVFYSLVSKNGITAQKEEAAATDSAVVTDAFQENEEDGEYVSESDLESDDEQIPQKPQISERRRNQNKTFMSWCVLNISVAFSLF